MNKASHAPSAVAAAALALVPVMHRDHSPETHSEARTDVVRSMPTKQASGGINYALHAEPVHYAYTIVPAKLVLA
jgi:hypothetical protein